MATVDGNLLPSGIYSEEPTNPDFGNLVEPDYTIAEDRYPLVFGTIDRNQPLTEVAQSRQGNQWPSYGFLDFYNRIHISHTTLNLGNLVSLQQRELSVFNAYFVPRTLNDITVVGDDGLNLIEPQATPFAFAPLQELIYILEASTDGPPTIDATYTFDFDVRDFEVHVVGVRIVAWQWEANWIQPVVERLEWLTDILPAYDGSEQRRKLRAWPRISYEFTFDAQDGARRLLENVVYGWGGRIWALPIWPDIQVLTEPLLAGATVIPSATAGRDFHLDGLAVLIGDSGTPESVEVDAIAADSITLQRPLVSSWPVGTRLYPARTARMEDPRGWGRMTRNYVRGLVRFKTVEEIEAAVASEAVYRDYPVMTYRPNWREAPEIDYQRKLATLAFGTGRDSVTDEAELALPMHTWRWTMLTREDVIAFREWIYARAGRAKAIWLPTWSDDLVLADEVAPSAVNIDFQAAGLAHFAQAGVHRTDVRIELTNGTVLYRRLSNFVTVDDATERATMNSIFGITVTPAMIESISWMHLVRLDTDSIEITWHHAGVAEATIIMKGPRNGV